ncbi:hypothetical protein [Nocardia sp. CC227C]|uniref:hypothetical protein n=1 Tax=Nocardia sp. CC227C TaxID=3044562 RepID=UPI00278C7C3E|nr:hypothetical protein [Nocardia sp. CC227C]
MAMAVLCALAPIAGCASSDDEQPPSPVLTQVDARQRIEAYLTETLNALPTGVRLTLSPERLPAEGPSADEFPPPMAAAPCDGDMNDTAGPVKAQVLYYLSGIPSGQANQYYTKVMKYWVSRLWNVTETELTIQAMAATDDGYQLVVRHGNAAEDGVGEDVLILAGTSPCFPRTATAESTVPLPARVEQG